MIRLKRKNLPRLLQRALQAEARKLEPPPCQQLWVELQQRPEFAAAKKNAEQLFPQLDMQKPGEPKRTGAGLYAFYRKHPGLAGLIAAGLLLVVFLSRLLPWQSVPFLRSADTFPQEQISFSEVDLQDASGAGANEENAVLYTKKMEAGTGGNADPAADPAELDENAALKGFCLGGKAEEAAAGTGAPPPVQDTSKHMASMAAESSPAQDTREVPTARESQPEKENQPERENQQSPATFNLQAGENSALESPLRDSRLDRSLRAVPEKQIFTEEKPFFLALKEARQLTGEEIWQVKTLPEKVSFQEGTIVRTAETLWQVEQVFAGEGAKEGFTLIQQFTPEEIKNDSEAGWQSIAEETAGEANADPLPEPEETKEGKANADPLPEPEETEEGANAGLPIAQGPAQPMQIGPYHGYLLRSSPASCTLTWLQEKSTVTLSGQLTEETLQQVLGALESPGGKGHTP